MKFRLKRDTTFGPTAGWLPGLFQLHLKGNPRGGRYDAVRILSLPARSYDSAGGDQRSHLRVGDVVLALNGRAVKDFDSLEAVMDWVRRQGNDLEVVIHADDRGELPAKVPKRVLAADFRHHMQSVLIQARAALPLFSLHAQQGDGGGSSSRSGCLGLFQLGSGGWFDSVRVNVVRLRLTTTRSLGEYATIDLPTRHGVGGRGESRFASAELRGRSPASDGRARFHSPSTAAMGPLGRSHQEMTAPSPSVASACGGMPASSPAASAWMPPPDARSQMGRGRGLSLGTGAGPAAALLSGGPEGLRDALVQLLKPVETRWLELRSLKTGCFHRTRPLWLDEDAAVEGVAIVMPVLPFGDTIRVSLHSGKQFLFGEAIVGNWLHRSKEHEDGRGEIEVSFEQMAEGRDVERPNVALQGPNGEINGYVHLVLQYRSDSALAQHHAAITIQRFQHGHRVRNKYSLHRHRAAAAPRTTGHFHVVSQVLSHAQELKVLKAAQRLQRYWRGTVARHNDLDHRLSLLPYYDLGLLRKPLRICLFADRKIGVSDGIYSPRGTLRLDSDRGALVFHTPRDWMSRVLRAARALFGEQGRVGAEQRQSSTGTAMGSRRSVGQSIVASLEGEAPQDDGMLAFQALSQGEVLPISKVTRIAVHDHSDARLVFVIGSGAFQSFQHSSMLVLQAHSSASMLVWMRVLQTSVRAKREAQVDIINHIARRLHDRRNTKFEAAGAPHDARKHRHRSRTARTAARTAKAISGAARGLSRKMRHAHE